MVLSHSNGMSFIENLLELNSRAAYLYHSVLLDIMFESRKGKPSIRPIKGFGTPAFDSNYNGCTPFKTKKIDWIGMHQVMILSIKCGFEVLFY